MRGISLPAAQLFVIAIENILRGRGGGNLTRTHYKQNKTYLKEETARKKIWSKKQDHRGKRGNIIDTFWFPIG